MNEDQEQKSIQLRALLAFALSAVVLFAYSHFFVKPPPAKPAASETTAAPAASAPAAASPADAPTLAAAAPAVESSKPAATNAKAQEAKAEQILTVETRSYLVTFSNRGAVATSWTLKDYKDEAGHPLELVNSAAAPVAGYPFSYAPQAELNQHFFQVETDPRAAGGAGVRVTAPVTIKFQWSDGRTIARKSFHFNPDNYLVQIESSLTRDGAPQPHFLTWRGGFGDTAVEDSARTVRTFYFDNTQTPFLSSAPGKIVRVEAKAASNGPVVNAGNYVYAGIEDHYFAAAFLTETPGVPLKLETTAVAVTNPKDKKQQTFASAAIGGAGENKFEAYIGPKTLITLRSVKPQLTQLVDFGFFSFIAYPLFLMLAWTHRWVPSFGWAIAAVTLIINFILFPLKLKSMTSMKKMQKLQPLIKHINDKYKGLGMRDPKRQDQNQEVMALYEKYGVNPLGGCLPMLLQIPFFFAFYAVLNSAIEMRGTRWLWIRDLSAYDHIYLLPIIMIATQFLAQKMTPNTAADPSQQKMMQFMPLFMGFFFYRLPSGLVLYWTTSNLVNILQQWFINRLPEPELEIGKPKKGKAKDKSDG